MYLSKSKRDSFIQWYENIGNKFIISRLNKGPKKVSSWTYGIVLMAAIDREIDLQIAKKWARPSNYALAEYLKS